MDNEHALYFGSEALHQSSISHCELGIYCSDLLYHVLYRLHAILSVWILRLMFNIRL